MEALQTTAITLSPPYPSRSTGQHGDTRPGGYDECFYAMPRISWSVSQLYPEEEEHRTQSETAQIERVLIFLESKGILIPQPAVLRNYLRCYGHLTLILAYVCHRAHQRFTPENQLCIDLYQDPEINDSYLTLYVRQENYDGTLMKEIKTFRKSYETLLVGKSGWLHVTTDFRPPLQANK